MTPFPTKRIISAFGIVWLLCFAGLALERSLPGVALGDTNKLFIPFRSCLLRMFWSGNFPDLVPGMFFGHPILSFGQAGVFYPTNLLGYIFPLPHFWFFGLDLWIHAVVASVGCAWLLWRRGRSLGASMALAWIYANSSAFLMRSAGHWTLLHQAALFPWLIGTWQALGSARSNNKLRSFTHFALVLALMLLAQNPQWLYALAILLAPLELARIAQQRRLLKPMERIASLVLALLFAAALGSASLIPMVSILRESARNTLAGMANATNWILTPFNLLTLFFPYALFGKSMGDFHGQWSPIESAIITGRATIVLAISGLASYPLNNSRRIRQAVLPIVLIVGGLVFSLAGTTPYGKLMVDYLPLFSAFRAWGRASIFVVMGLVILAADGFDALFSKRSQAGLPVVSGTLVAFGFAAIAFSAAWFTDYQPAQAAEFFLGHASAVSKSRHVLDKMQIVRDAFLRDGAIYGLWGLIGITAFWAFGKRIRFQCQHMRTAALMLIIVESLCFQRFVLRDRVPVRTADSEPEIATWLRQLRATTYPAPVTVALQPRSLRNDALFFDGIRDINGADANMRQSYAAWLNDVQGYPSNSYQLDTHIAMFTPQLVEACGLAASVDEDKDSSGSVPSFERLGRFNIHTYAPARPYAELVFATDHTGATSGTLAVKEWHEDAALILVSTKESGVVIVRELPDKSWRIRLDGRQLPPQSSGDRLQIPVQPGTHEIELAYVDSSARIGAAISLISWALVGAGLLARRAHNKRSAVGVAVVREGAGRGCARLERKG